MKKTGLELIEHRIDLCLDKQTKIRHEIRNLKVELDSLLSRAFHHRDAARIHLDIARCHLGLGTLMEERVQLGLEYNEQEQANLKNQQS